MGNDGQPPPTAPVPGKKPRDDFRIEDERWAARRQLRDWMWLGLMIIVFSAWTLIVYFLEPGLR
jgi:hypothetical protein